MMANPNVRNVIKLKGGQVLYQLDNGMTVSPDYFEQNYVTKAVRKSSSTQSNSASSVASNNGNDLGLWMTENQNAMGNQQRYSQALSQDYLDAQERYISMASDAQKQANDFNAEQAKIQRDWSEAMSANAHQREVKDLKAAGLNPVISAYGSGASVGSGAAASSSNNLTSAFGNLASQALGAVASLAQTMETNATSYANAGLSYGANLQAQEMQKYVADLNAKTSLSMNEATNSMNRYIAELNQMNQKEIARIAADASVSSAEIHAAASNYSADVAYASALKTAAMNNQTSKEVAELNANKTFEGIASTGIKKAADFLSDYLSGSGSYGVHNYNQSIGQE